MNDTGRCWVTRIALGFPAKRLPAERANLGDELFAIGLVEPAGGRLLKRVGRAQGERLDSGFGAVGREAGHDEYLGFARPLDHLRQRAETAHAGHLEVEQDHVDLLAGKQLERVLGRRNGGGQHKRFFLFDEARERRPDDQRIIDDHHADAATVPEARSLAGPAYGRGEAH
jgi:hypothetical protein